MRTLVFSTVLALGALGCSEQSASKDSKAQVGHDLPEMSVNDVAAGLEAKQLTVVDCNGEKTRKKHGILPGAILLEDEETFAAGALPADKATKLVFYCGGPG
ncbi:MAG: rhodanese-like domain-containing protein [Myxococcota bacterium]|nr:rhodanese-like domain-containing protein [Myxococcota bacterium]